MLSTFAIFVHYLWIMKIFKVVFFCFIFVLFIGCNHNDDPLVISYFSSIVFEEYTTNFSENSVESKELFNSLHSEILEVRDQYGDSTNWTVSTTWGNRHDAYAKNDSIALDRYDSAVARLYKIQEVFEIEKENVAQDGSFIIQLSFLVTRDQKLRESQPIVYSFGY